MYSFGARSERQLSTCDMRIVRVLREAIKEYDFSVLKGERNKEEQNKAYFNGASKLMYPESKHNKSPSQAVDIVPYPVDWDNLQRFHELADVIKKVCIRLDEEDLHWGYDLWKWDMPHWELR